ncbi:MAG TPA: M28 family peptidase, partial [Anaerolineae bacterium]|nr:M28 family peptidase [Anaerolineae bacterium]
MRRLLFSTLLGLGLAVLVLAAPGLAQSPDGLALVRVDLAGADDLARVDGLDVPIYAHLTVPGADYLLAVLTPQQQEQLRSLGLPLTVLDADAEGAVYYLVESGQPRVAERVAPAFAIVHDDGRQAVGRLQEGVRAQAAEESDVRVVRLGPDPIVLTPRVTGDVPTAPVYDPLIAGLLTRVTTGTLAAYDGGLSGEWPVPIGGQPYVFRTRYTYSGEPIAKATQYVYEHMRALGYDVRYHDYTLSGYALRNVVGERRGLVHPDQVVLLTAHLDSRAAGWPHDPAPGADDNGSGSAALMAAADVLAVLDFDYTIRIVFFTGEEQGMWGSYYYARDVADAGEDVLGVLNLDMIAWDAKSGPAIDLHSHVPSVEDDSDDLADLFAAVVDVYGLDLEPQIIENGARFSDHSRFWDRGYAAIMAIEDYYNTSEAPYEPRDWNPNYHTTGDRLSTLNLAYFREYARASLAAFAHLARPVPTTISGTVTGAGTGAPLSATVTAAGPDGAFGDTTDVSGAYSFLLRPGVYTVNATAPGYSPQALAGVAALTGTTTRVDFVLEPLSTYTVSGSVTDAVSGLPLAATVRFDGGPAIAAPSGHYSASVPGGTYVMSVDARYHRPATRTVVVDRDQRQDFALAPTACVLVVDDDYDSDGKAYGDEVYYTAALEGLGVGYDVWAVADDADGPPVEVLARYRGVIWLTGRDWDYTLTGADQEALTAYLEGGGRLFVSGQDIGWDVARRGEPSFYRDYLHADYLRDDSGYHELAGAGVMEGLAVTIAGGDGADNQ